MSAPANILAIVGRPNVGKSALFNCIVGRRIAIVHEQAGVTRDRVSAYARYGNKSFEVVDTGGIDFLDDEQHGDALAIATRQQAEVAIAMAGAVIFVVDVMTGITPLDLDIARRLRASAKPVFLAVNKVDNDRRGGGVDEFATLGFDPLFPIAAIHGDGVEALVAAATAGFSASADAPSPQAPRIAIFGRPNVGKSSIVNAILKDNRTIVSDVPGTTRDSVEVPFTLDGKSYVLVDTAGLRHKRKIKTSVDQFALMRAERSIKECDVAVMVIDASSGVTKQDKAIAGQILAADRPCVVLVNKWDLMRESEDRQREPPFRDAYVARLRRDLFFLDWAPVLLVSAKTGQRLRDLFRQVELIERERAKRIDTPALNKLLTHAIAAYPPPSIHGRRFKVYYAFQAPSRGGHFVLFVNDKRCLTPHYERFLIDRLRAKWGFVGCPIKLLLRDREHRQFFFREETRAGTPPNHPRGKKS